jgi:DNA-binding protein HU-beta
MNKKELGDAVGASFGGSKAMGSAAVDAVINAIVAALAKGEKVQIAGFGNFEVKNRPARMGRNPRTGEPVHIAASKAPSFKVSKTLKDAVNG